MNVRLFLRLLPAAVLLGLGIGLLASVVYLGVRPDITFIQPGRGN